MGRVSLNESRQFSVRIESLEDEAAFRVALRAADGADKVTPRRGSELCLSSENPFNAFAIWFSGFEMDTDSLRLSLDMIAPIAWGHMGIHSPSFRRLTMMRIKDLPRPGDRREPGAGGKEPEGE